ncbi:hypothetical protein MSG28_008046 [Choristoneura fumiferana]|uniref:Uncharacterized protein n=1 Tax=Choristoneura fumiferana TaxID=7141 RepID=A0ACC0J9N4_CHOFU|nr:hypothetical protein MSG28_008046 [Choristoneura fumiferana]
MSRFVQANARFNHCKQCFVDSYNLVFLAVTYVAPMSVMVWAYARMGATLRGRAIGECTHHQMQVVRAKRKVVRMFVLVVVVFALCWLPYHAYFVLVYHHQRLASAPVAQHVYLLFYWLAMANSMFNPLIYYWMSNKLCSLFPISGLSPENLRARRSTESNAAN